MDGLNIFDPRDMQVYMSEVNNTSQRYFFAPPNMPFENPGVKFFGCDVRLVPLQQKVIYMTAEGDIKNAAISIEANINAAPTDPDGIRVKGLQDTLDACGSGWTYYYKGTYHGAFVSTDAEEGIFMDSAGKISINHVTKGCASFIIYQVPQPGETQMVPVILCNGTIVRDEILTGPAITE